MTVDRVVPRVVGRRILLDSFEDADIADHVRGEDDETARRFGWWPKRSTEETTRAAYAGWAESWRTGGDARAFAVRRIEDRALVGGCELRTPTGQDPEISWWTHFDARGNGFATEAVCLLLGYARSLGLTSVTAEVAVDNAASRRVAENVGYVEVGSHRGDDGVEMVDYRLDLGAPEPTRGSSQPPVE